MILKLGKMQWFLLFMIPDQVLLNLALRKISFGMCKLSTFTIYESSRINLEMFALHGITL